MRPRAAGALIALSIAMPAGAQVPEVNLSLFRPAAGSDGTIGVDGARPTPAGVDPIELQLLLDGALHPVRDPFNRIDRRLGAWIGMQGRLDPRLSLFVPRCRGYLEIDARTSLRALSVASAPAEWRVGARACAFGLVAFDAAAGTRLDNALGAPDLRVLLSVRYAPASCAAPRAAA